MAQIIVGLLLLLVGVWGITRNWYQFLDLMLVLLPVALLLWGVVSIFSGISAFGKDRRQQNVR